MCNFLLYKSLKYSPWLAALLLWPLTLSVAALPQPRSPSPDNSGIITGQRIMRTFDFEERDIHFEILPMHWIKVTGRYLREFGFQEGFPHYSHGKLDTTHHRSGSYSFQLIPDGGSVGFEFNRRQIRIKPGSDFQISGYVHLENADLCRARISCALTDRLGRIIPESLRKSKFVGRDDHDPTGWARLEVYIPGNFPEARFVTVSLWLLQEKQWNPDKQLNSHIFQKNVHAAAWFDDISIDQLPRVILRTDQPGNIFTGDIEPALKLEVEGVGSLDYNVHLRVQTADGRPILDKQWVLSGVDADPEPTKLPNLPAGLYRAYLHIFSAGIPVASRKLTFVRLAPLYGSSAGSGQGFGVILMDENRGDWDAAIQLTSRANAKLLKLPVWRRRPDQPGAIFSQENFDKMLIQLQRKKIQVVATFSEVPDSLALKMNMGQRSLLDVLSRDVQVWRPQIAFVLAQYARQVPFWQIGADLTTRQIWDPRIRNVIDAMTREFDKLVSNTVLAVPLNCMFEINRDQIGTNHVALRIPASIPPAQIPAYLDDCRQRGLDHLWATLEPLDIARYHREQVLIDFAKRIVFTKKGHARAIFINHPWTQREYNARQVTEPTELYPVFRTLADLLGATRYVGQFDLAPGIPALIFDRDGQGCLIAWNTRYDPQKSEPPPPIQLYLGQAPTQIDLFGNSRTVPLHNGLARLHLTHWPIILNNIDSRIALLRATLQLSPNIIDASISRQRLKLKFTNPFATTVSGNLRFLIDRNRYRHWMVDPANLPFILQAGQTFEQEITLKFPSNELGGRKKLDTLFTIDADRNYNIRAAIPFEIRLSGVEMSIFTRRLNRRDLLIQQVVTNDSDKEISLNSFVDLPDHDRLERAIARLQPGATVTKNFLIRDAARWLGRYLRIGLEDPKGTKRINYHIEIN